MGLRPALRRVPAGGPLMLIVGILLTLALAAYLLYALLEPERF